MSVFANLLVVILNQNERHLLDWTFHNDVVRLTLDITIIVGNRKRHCISDNCCTVTIKKKIIIKKNKLNKIKCFTQVTTR